MSRSIFSNKLLLPVIHRYKILANDRTRKKKETFSPLTNYYVIIMLKGIHNEAIFSSFERYSSINKMFIRNVANLS